MGVALVKPNMHCQIRGSLLKPSVVRFYVEASEPVDVYVVDPSEYEVFHAGDDMKSLGSHKCCKVYEQKIRLNLTGDYYLLIVNNGNVDSAVYWEF